jgi:hypothetical protein
MTGLPIDFQIQPQTWANEAEFGALAASMNDLLPEGPDKTVALRAIRDASMQANAVIACAQRVYGP